MLAGGVLNGAFAVGDELRAALAVAGLTTDWTSNVLLQLSFSSFGSFHFLSHPYILSVGVVVGFV
jgi:hypothetical protein